MHSTTQLVVVALAASGALAAPVAQDVELDRPRRLLNCANGAILIGNSCFKTPSCPFNYVWLGKKKGCDADPCPSGKIWNPLSFACSLVPTCPEFHEFLGWTKGCTKKSGGSSAQAHGAPAGSVPVSGMSVASASAVQGSAQPLVDPALGVQSSLGEISTVDSDFGSSSEGTEDSPSYNTDNLMLEPLAIDPNNRNLESTPCITTPIIEPTHYNPYGQVVIEPEPYAPNTPIIEPTHYNPYGPVIEPEPYAPNTPIIEPTPIDTDFPIIEPTLIDTDFPIIDSTTSVSATPLIDLLPTGVSMITGDTFGTISTIPFGTNLLGTLDVDQLLAGTAPIDTEALSEAVMDRGILSSVGSGGSVTPR